jgi:acetyl-CoA carboxylase / biotin carboxylase 1
LIFDTSYPYTSANAEYIRMAEVIVDVPGGSNNHNYANVTLIVELARLHGVHAVWAGWGHASENPSLPDSLAKSQPPIKFIGPSGPPMRALGDKIGSTIIAQSAGVPCIAWNGQHVKASYDKVTGSLPEKAFEDATIVNATEAEAAAKEIGFPVMIKASEGGGGKGIRRVDKLEDVANSFRQVCGEVPGSPIFIMKLSSNSRHLEVQLLADEYGDAVALNGRDCSVQRRHQKIIEEGPPVAANPQVWTQMEQAAVALAKAVQYANAGTVEYLYSEREAKFYFLELNPRLQVEHPVTEMVTRVNLPAAQLQVAMGIPLYNIPDIRELYGRHRFEDDPHAESCRIDFESTPRTQPHVHCIAVRITAENAEAGFKPTSGGIQELNFRSTPNVWGYFSMDSSGSIHEFADSQFGHLFANGPDREDARRNMVLALKELSIRGDISTTVDYISKLIELEDFVANRIDTGWLDAIIRENIDGMGTAEGILKYRTSVNVQALSDHMYVVLAASICAYDSCASKEKRFVDLLEKGQLPSRSLLSMKHTVELILSGIKYKLCCVRSGQTSFSVSIVDTDNSFVAANVRVLSDGGYLIDVGGTSHVAYLSNKADSATGMRINVGGKNVVFSPDYDPTALRTDVAGKLVKKLKPDGSRVKKGEPYCEIEVMKMFMPLKVEESGILSWSANEGAAVATGDLLANLELDNPDNVAKATVFQGKLTLPDSATTGLSSAESTPHLLLRSSIDKLESVFCGFQLTSDTIDSSFSNLASAVTRPFLPVMEVEEQLSVLSGRIPSSLTEAILSRVGDFSNKCSIQAGSGLEVRYVGFFSLVGVCKHHFVDTANSLCFMQFPCGRNFIACITSYR